MNAIVTKLHDLGYSFEAAPVQTMSFHSAERVGDIVYTSGQIPILGDEQYKGKVGADIDLETAKRAAEICAYNCLRAVGSVADVEDIERIVKLFGMVNVAPGFNDTSGVINGATDFFNEVFGERAGHARSAVGMTLPGDWAVEVEIVVKLTS
jgi:enamine deaminase RidA (YjgF/YER057c/UK114 family)